MQRHQASVGDHLWYSGICHRSLRQVGGDGHCRIVAQSAIVHRQLRDIGALDIRGELRIDDVRVIERGATALGNRNQRPEVSQRQAVRVGGTGTIQLNDRGYIREHLIRSGLGYGRDHGGCDFHSGGNAIHDTVVDDEFHHEQPSFVG